MSFTACGVQARVEGLAALGFIDSAQVVLCNDWVGTGNLDGYLPTLILCLREWVEVCEGWMYLLVDSGFPGFNLYTFWAGEC